MGSTVTVGRECCCGQQCLLVSHLPRDEQGRLCVRSEPWDLRNLLRFFVPQAPVPASRDDEKPAGENCDREASGQCVHLCLANGTWAMKSARCDKLVKSGLLTKCSFIKIFLNS